MPFEVALLPLLVEQKCFFGKENKKILCRANISAYTVTNKTCQGYARKRTLKPAGFSFLAGQY
jgi:hypothetical protein